MTGIEDPNVIDLVALDAAGDCMVVMVETRPWDASDEQPEQLKQKVNAYAGYILDGTLARQYPDIHGKAVSIRLDCLEVPSGEIAVIIEWAMRQLRPHSIGFTVVARS